MNAAEFSAFRESEWNSCRSYPFNTIWLRTLFISLDHFSCQRFAEVSQVTHADLLTQALWVT